MLLASALPVVIASIALTAPGVIWAWWRYPAGDGAARLSVGIALGFAFQIHICALLAVGPRITGPSVVVATLMGSGLAILLVWLTRNNAPRAPRGLLKRSINRQSVELVALLALVTAPRLLPLATHAIPPGWDTTFHSLLASTTVASGKLPSWQPFEQIPSNYPYGPHVFIAEITLLTGVAPDAVFGILLFAVQPLITCLALYSLARRTLRSHAYALGAVAAYGLLGNWGSIEYAEWGGLPNALGFFLVLVFLSVLFTPRYERTRILVGGIVLGAIPLTHHHVMLTTVLLLAAYVAYLGLWRIVIWKRHTQDIQVRRLVARLALTCLVGVITASYYVVPIALRLTELGQTRALQYFDDYSGVFFYKNGLLLWELAGIGAALVIAGLYSVERLHRSTIGLPELGRAFLAIAITALFLAFFLGYYVYRYYSFHFTSARQPYTLFTPSRFLTDMTYFLAMFAGIPLAVAWRWPTAWARMAKVYVSSNLRRALTVATRVAIVWAVGITCWGFVAKQISPIGSQLQPGEAEAFAWLNTHTPGDTLVVNLDPNANWAPYFTQREVAYTPIPTSEFTGGYVAEKQSLVGVLRQTLSHAPATHIVAFAGAGSAARALGGRPVAILTVHPIPGASDPPAFVSGPEHVYLLGSAFAFTQHNLSTRASVAFQWWPQRATPPAGWATSATASSGWLPGTPPAGDSQSVVDLRLVLTSPLPAGSRIACGAQNGAEVFVDGQQVQGGCRGGFLHLPPRVTTRPHVIGFRMQPGTYIDPWYYVALQE